MMTQAVVLPGVFTLATLPPASAYTRNIAWVTDRPGEPGPMISDGTSWRYFISGKRIEVQNGVTDATGVVSFTYSAPFTTIDHISQERFPPTDSSQFSRLLTQTMSGCSVICEQRASLSLLGLNLLSFATTVVPGQKISICVVGT